MMQSPLNGDKKSQDSIHVEEIEIKGGKSRTVTSHQLLHDESGCTSSLDTTTTTADTDTTGTLSLGEKIETGRIILTVANLITEDEIEYLVQSSLAAASVIDDASALNTDQGLQGRFYTRMPTIAAAQRANCLEYALPEPITQLLEQIVERTLTLVDEQLCPSIKETLFFNNHNDAGTSSSNSAALSIAELYRTNQLEYSDREPAINVYRAPTGHFGMHKDGKALTMLVPLSDSIRDFEGGGTAFWSQKYPQEGLHDPSLVLAPPPGTILLFGGKVSHKGLHIQSGTRVVFVASFSRSTTRQQP